MPHPDLMVVGAAIVCIGLAYIAGRGEGRAEMLAKREPDDPGRIIDDLLNVLAPFAIHGQIEARWADRDTHSVTIPVGAWRRAFAVYGAVSAVLKAQRKEAGDGRYDPLDR